MNKLLWLIPIVLILFSCSGDEDKVNLEPVKSTAQTTGRNIISDDRGWNGPYPDNRCPNCKRR